MILYHVSFDPISKFDLRVPTKKLDGEDGTTKRVCLAPSILSCLNAKAFRSGPIQVALERHIPLCLFVYETDVVEDILTPPNILQTKYGVEDAVENQEYWATQVPDFKEHIFLVTGAEFFEDEFGIVPMVSSIQLDEINAVPEHCAHLEVQKLNSILGTRYRTDDIVYSYEELFDKDGRLWDPLPDVAYTWLCPEKSKHRITT